MRGDWAVSSTSGVFSVTAGSLRLNNLAADTFAFGCPGVAFEVGDPVHVRHNGRLVFSGKIYAREREDSRGTTVSRPYTARGPWQALDDLIYRQQWMALGASGPAAQYFSRVILNQGQSGSPMALKDQILDILAPAAATGALAVGTVSVPEICLPADEQRSVTLAQALMRCLRLFPAVATWFDYSGPVPVLNVGAGAEAAWMDDPGLRRTLLSESRSGSPPDGVVLEIETTGDFNGNAYRKVDVQTAGDAAEGRKVLYIPLDLSGAGGSVTSASLKVETEDIPQDWQTNKAWWKQKHPRLENVDEHYLELKDASRSGDLPRITSVPMKDIGAAGLRAEMDTFRVKAKIPTLGKNNEEIDVEEDVLLTMDFITTSAQTRRYSWVESSSATSGEWVPDGLAEAILAQHAHDGEALGVTARPPLTAWPVPGQTRGGLICQEVGHDLAADLMEVTFGPPAQLSAQDLAGLMTGWRNQRRATSSNARATGEPKDDAKVDHTAVAPVKTTEFSPGKKTKIGAEQAGQTNDPATAVVDPSRLPEDNNKAELREVEYVSDVDADGNPVKSRAYFLVNEPRDADASGPDDQDRECAHDGAPDGTPYGSGGGHDGDHPGVDTPGGGHEGGGHPGKTGPCW